MRKERIDYAIRPEFEKIPGSRCAFLGPISERLAAITTGWLIPAPLANPAMIGMFKTRDRERDFQKLPWTDALIDILPWSGEFAGKHLLSAQLVYRVTSEPGLGKSIDRLVRELVSVQAPDGYLGPFSRDKRLTGDWTWDIWGHYHCILALLMYHEDSGWEPALTSARRAADLLCDTYLPGNFRMTNDGSKGEQNYAIIHGMTALYRRTGDQKYLDMARWVIREWDRPGTGEYITSALAGKPVVEFPAHRWESAHDWQGIAEMYLLTGERDYLRAFTHIWRDCLRGDRHNTGGWTAGEGIQNNPYHPGAIETCCTVAWIALSIDMLRLTGDPLVADELELSTWNALLGGMHPTGRWWTYNTPMDGAKRAAIHDIAFQQRAGSPELNCCSVNAPRGLGMIRDWAVMRTSTGYALNWYGPGTITVPLETGGTLKLAQQTCYPLGGYTELRIGLDSSRAFTLDLRIPSWSEKTSVTVNGRAMEEVRPGTYLRLDRTWKNGDSIKISLDLSPHFWSGERDCAGKTSLYRGPLLLAWDQRWNEGKLADIPELDAEKIEFAPAEDSSFPTPWALFRVKAADGREITLSDFATAGMTGTLYRTWLPVRGLSSSGTTPPRPVWAKR